MAMVGVQMTNYTGVGPAYSDIDTTAAEPTLLMRTNELATLLSAMHEQLDSIGVSIHPSTAQPQNGPPGVTSELLNCTLTARALSDRLHEVQRRVGRL